MGNEASCTVRLGNQRSQGKALLETTELIFRGDFRLKIPFSAMKSVGAAKGELRVQGPDGEAIFELGETAAKWREKILHPKSRIEKLGVKRDARVSLLGHFQEEFRSELRERTRNVSHQAITSDAEWIFFAAGSKKELAKVAEAREKDAWQHGAVGGVSQRTKSDYRARCAGDGQEIGIERRESCRIFAQAHCTEICDSSRGAMSSRASLEMLASFACPASTFLFMMAA